MTTAKAISTKHLTTKQGWTSSSHLEFHTCLVVWCDCIRPRRDKICILFPMRTRLALDDKETQFLIVRCSLLLVSWTIVVHALVLFLFLVGSIPITIMRHSSNVLDWRSSQILLQIFALGPYHPRKRATLVCSSYVSHFLNPAISSPSLMNVLSLQAQMAMTVVALTAAILSSYLYYEGGVNFEILSNDGYNFSR